MSNQDKGIIQNIRSVDVINDRTSDISKHFDGMSHPKLPDSATLELGEIALNIAKGYEIIAIKNIEGEVIYLPFNIAVRLLDVEDELEHFEGETLDSLSAVSASTISLYNSLDEFKQEITSRLNDEISKVSDKIDDLSGSTEEAISIILNDIVSISAETQFHFTDIEDEISILGDRVEYGFGVVNDKINELSGKTEVTFTALSGSVETISAETIDIFSFLDNKIDEVSGNTLDGYDTLNERIDSLHVNVENELSVLSGDIQSLSSETRVALSEFENCIVELSGKTGEGFDVVNNNLELLSGETIERLSSLSGTVQTLSSATESTLSGIYSKLDKLSGDTIVGYDSLNQKLESFSADTKEKIDALNDEIIDGRIYVDNSISSLSASTDQKIDEVSGSCESNYTELYKFIEDNELVHAAAFSRINTSLGFNENAEFVPMSIELSGKNVTEAIDYLYSEYDDVLSYLNDERSSYFMRSVTYEGLGKLILQNKLLNGMLYRITNYQATVASRLTNVSTRVPLMNSGAYTNNGFDIIVRAVSNNKLDENAILTMSRDNFYFEDCSIESWEVKYSYYNDITRFDWAKENGYGVIYYMKDNYGNEASYDFKNIKFKHDNEYMFTFHDIDNGMDASLIGLAKQNIIKPVYVDNMFNQSILKLNCNIFIGTDFNGNFTDIGLHDFIVNGNASCCRINGCYSNTIIQGPINNQVIGYIHLHRIID